MTRLFIGCLGTETNTFVPFPTGRRAFESREHFRGDATKHPATTFTAPLHAWRRRARKSDIRECEARGTEADG